MINFPYSLSLLHKKDLFQVEFIQFTNFEQAIWKSRHRNLGIGSDIDIGIGIQIKTLSVTHVKLPSEFYILYILNNSSSVKLQPPVPKKYLKRSTMPENPCGEVFFKKHRRD